MLRQAWSLSTCHDETGVLMAWINLAICVGCNPHWLQVLEWTQTILAAGEAFCGSESATLRDALRRQSGRFFAAFHSANLQACTSAKPGLHAQRGGCLIQICWSLAPLSFVH